MHLALDLYTKKWFTKLRWFYFICSRCSIKTLVRHILAVIIVALLAFGTSYSVSSTYAAAGINQTINFQGKLVNSSGLNVADGNYDITFYLYAASSGGSALWTEVWNTGTAQVPVQDGVFRVALGTHSVLTSFNFNDDSLYLAVKVGADPEMTPRIRFTSVPYAFVAKTVVDDALDFDQFKDTMALDANTTVNQSSYTWTQNFTGNTTTGYTYNANSLTTGKGLFVSSSATGLTGNLAEFMLSGSNAGNTGNVVRIAQTGTSSAAVPLVVTNLGTGLSFRVNDETGDADSTAFVVDAAGNVGIGLTAPLQKLHVSGNGRIDGGLYMYGSPLNVEVTRALPTTVGNTIEIGNLNVTNGAHNVRLSVTVPSSSNSVAKQYLIPVSYGQTSGAWQIVQPISDTGAYSGNNFAIEINVNTNVATFRLRRTAGTTAGTAYVRLESTGYSADAWTDSSTTSTSSVTAIFSSTPFTQVAGNVGIGTTSPSSKLTVEGALTVSNQSFGSLGIAKATITSNDTWGTRLNLGNTDTGGGTIGFMSYGSTNPYAAAGTFAISTNGLDRFSIVNDGSVGIGTNYPSSIFHTVASGAKTANYIGNLLTNTATSSTASITKTGLSVESTGTWNGTTAVNRGLYVNATGGTTNYAAIFDGGNVGIGTTNPGGLLHVNVGSVPALGAIRLTNGANTYFSVNAVTNNSLFLGTNAGSGATGAILSNFFGYDAGLNATNASDSNFFGYQAGANATSGGASNFLGTYAGQNATNAGYGNYLGYEAGRTATNASNSNFLGYRAGYGATGASYANYLGMEAGSGATAASYSTLIGYQAGKTFSGNNIGSNNIILGTNISLPNTTANALNIGGVIFGTGLYSTTAGNPSTSPVSGGNIGIGVVSPTQRLHVDGNLRLTGALYDSSNSAGSNTNILTSTGTGTAWTNLSASLLPSGTEGQTLYNNAGTWTANSGLFYDDVNARVGIGTTAPGSLLDVNGATTIRLPAVGVNSYMTLTSGTATVFNTRFGTTASNQYAWFTNLYYNAGWYKDDGTRGAWRMNQVTGTTDVNNSFNLDYAPVGSTSPITVFTVKGNSTGGNVGIQTATPLSPLHITTANAVDSRLTLTQTGAQNWTLGNPASTTRFDVAEGADLTAPKLSIISGGNVGIGTTAPNTTLQVMGSLAIDSGFNTGISSLYLSHTGTSNQHKAGIFSTYTTGYGRSSSIQFALNSAMDGTIVTTADAKMTILEGGNVGIGTTGPSQSLSVNGKVKIGNFTEGYTTDYDLLMNSGIKVGGNINLRAPTNGDSGFTGFNYYNSGGDERIRFWQGSAEQMSLGGYGGVTHDGLRLNPFSNPNNTASDKIVMRLNPSVQPGSNYTGTHIMLDIAPASFSGYGDLIGLRIQNANKALWQTNASATNYFAGNVGIGTTAPGAKLQINGAASSVTSIFRANATTPGNISEWQDSTGQAGFLVDSTSQARFQYGTSGSTTTDGIIIKRYLSNVAGRSTMELAGTNTTYWTSGKGIEFTNHALGISVGAPTMFKDKLSTNQLWIGDSSIGSVDDFLIFNTADSGYVDILSMKYASSPYPDMRIAAPKISFFTKSGAAWPDGSTIKAYGTEAMTIDGTGNVGIGTTSPSALLHGIKTTEQLRLGYDASNYFSTTVSSTGAVTLDAVGSGAAFTMSDTLNVPSLYFSSSQAYLTYEDIDTLGFQGNLSVSDDLSILGATVLSATSSLSKPSGTGILSFSTSTATSGITLANTGSTTTGNSGISLSSNATTGTGVGITANSITSGTGLGVSTTSMNTGSLVSFSAAGTNGQTGHKVLNVSNNGTNIAGNQLTYGAYVTNTRSGGSAYNVAGYFSASGGALNYAALFDGGNVGIGTTAPGSKLEVTGDIKITNGTNRLILASNSSAPTGTAGAMYYDSSNNKFKCYTTSWVDCDTIGSGTLPSGSDGDTLYYETETGGWSSTNNLFNNGTNIGIGTTSPGSKLQVTGDIKLTDGANRLILASNASDPSGTAGAMYYNSTTKRFRCYQDGAWIDCIGYNPQRDVVIVDEFVGGTTSSANIGDLGWTLSAGTVAAVTPTGSNIGTIRLSTPATANGRGVLWLATGAGFVSLGNNGDIHITGKFAGVTSNANLTHYFGLIVSNANGNPANALMFRASGTGNWNAVNRASSSETGTVTDCSVAQSTTFRTFEIIVNSDATSVVYKIDGTTCATYTTNIPTSAVTLSPMFKVDTVDATARTVMDIDRFVLTRGQLRGADLAEFYYTQDPSINAGDIVSTSPQGATMVNKASTQNRQALLGVVSTKPGEVLGSSMGPGMPVMVGLAGRVPVKVTSENGPISVGDPITISSVPGVGMKATRAGAIVGRALEAYVNPDPTAIGNVMLFLSLEHYVPTLTPEQFGELVLRESAPQQFSIESLMGGRTLGREAFEAFDGLMVGRMQAGVTETQILRVGQSAQIAGIFAQQDGKVGIGTSAPTHTFEVKAKEKDIARFEAMDSTGCTLSAGGIISCSSDSALKKDVTDVVSGLDTLMQLRPVSFHWNSQGEEDEKYLGFIAQEVEEVLPELVTTDITGYKQLNSIGLIPVVAKAVQEQQGLILSLQQEVQASVPDTKIATLDEGIHTLTQKVGFWDGVLISFQSIIQSIQDTIASIQNQMLFTQDDIMLTRHQVNALAETVTDITAWKEAITSGAVVLGASHSALLTTPEATISALTITDSLQVDGSTTVFDLTVLNKLTTGVIELGAGIDGDEINSATGIRFQTLAQAPIDFMNGKVVIDVDGSIKASQLKIDTASELSSAAGKALMEAGELLVTVPTTRVSAESLVLLTVEGDYAPATRYWVTDVTDGESFTVRFDRPSIAPVTIHWMLVN